MSEAEKKRRKEYRALRKKRIMSFSLVLCGLVLLSTVFGIIYGVMNDKMTVAYTERSNVSYEVKLFPGEYFEGEWQAPGKSYIADLTDEVKATFDYTVSVDDPDAEYYYIESMTATLVVTDRQSKVPIYHPVDVIQNPTSASAKGNTKLSNTAFIDYDGYRREAAAFIEKYRLTNVDAYINVTHHVDTVGTRANSQPKAFESTLKLPLIEQTFRPETTASASTNAVQYFECVPKTGVILFLVFTIVFGSLSVIGAAALVVFIFLTRNHDINYAIKVKRLIATYRSFIQEMTTPFATEGYQVVYIKSFNEMLEVRDTIGSPLLMYENADGTATSFVIPSSMGILYNYEIRVEDYNDIYGITEEEGEDIAATDKPCFVTVIWGKVCSFFRNLKKKKPAQEEAATEAEAAAEGEATEAEDAEGIEAEASATTETEETSETEAEVTEPEAEELSETEAEVEATEAEETATEENAEAETEAEETAEADETATEVK